MEALYPGSHCALADRSSSTHGYEHGKKSFRYGYEDFFGYIEIITEFGEMNEAC